MEEQMNITKLLNVVDRTNREATKIPGTVNEGWTSEDIQRARARAVEFLTLHPTSKTLLSVTELTNLLADYDLYQLDQMWL